MKQVACGIYRHFKGAYIRVIGVSKHTETGEPLVVYEHLGTNELWSRPLDMFMSKVDKEKYPDAVQEYRFEFISY